MFPASSEHSRVTSPDGKLDAVLVVDAYGPAAGGGVDSMVYIVARGAQVPTARAHMIFRADPMTRGTLVWKDAHLLEIHYDVADIYEFHNLWALDEIENVGEEGERDAYVEIRLAPSSDRSVLNPDGSFRNGG